MSILNLISRFGDLGVTFHIDDNNLKINAPKGKLNPALINELKERKEEIIAFLKEHTQKQDKHAAIELAEEKEYYSLSSGQKRLFILYLLDKGGIGYNMPVALELQGKIDKKILGNVFKRLVQRHESFRTSFEMVGDEPVQIVHKNVEFEIEYYVAKEAVLPIVNNFLRPFDLSKAPLLRVGLIKVEEEKHILMLDMYHIISDGTSMGVLVKEFISFYSGEELPPPGIHYKDYSEWMRCDTQIEMVKKKEEFWLNQFEDEIPLLDLPMDFVRPGTQNFEGCVVVFNIGKKETEQLKALAMKEHATLYMILLSVYNIFLSKLSGKEDIIVGTPVAGRGNNDLQPVIGMFVNTLAMRNFPGGNKTFRQFFLEVKEQTFDAFANQDYPYEELVEKVVKEREPGRNPLFDTLFALQNVDIPTIEIPGLKLKKYESEDKVSKFDLSLEVSEEEDILYLTIKYNIKLFREDTIKRFIGYIKNIIEVVVKNNDIILSEIGIMSEEEKVRILNEFNKTEALLLEEKTVHDLFVEQAERTPDHIAIVGQSVQITYRELDEQSDRVAFLLNEKGALPGDIVGIKVERTVEMIVGILGILKAGAAYLPIDPKFPQERIDFMLKDSGAKIIIIDHLPPAAKNLFEKRFLDIQKLLVNACSAQPLNFSTSQLLISAAGGIPLTLNTNTCYIIYTSGTTGKPKGVMIEHRSVASRVKNPNFIQVKTGDRLLMTGSFIFDIAVFEIWLSLLNGMQLVLVDESRVLDAEKLKRVIAQKKINILHLIPQLFNQLANQDEEIFGYLDYFLVGGDVVNPHYVNRVREKYPKLKTLHMYGPTENTIFTSYLQVEKDYQGRIPIGKPIGNSIVSILDKYMQIQPIGAPGELCVGGAGVARGYLNKPELTAEKFILGQANLSPLYRTGDLSRWMQDGNIEFLGRRDQQVKIRGIRIEVEEIERILLKYEGIKEVVVIAKDVRGDKTLCAYIAASTQPGAFPGFITRLKDGLSQALPGYMIPAYFIEMKEIPLLPNGKIDRKAMPDPEISSGEAYIAPRNEMEEILVDIWSEVLEIEKSKISIDSDFFQLGGHSLKAILTAAKIRKRFDIDISLAELFQVPTISGLTSLFRAIELARNQEFSNSDDIEEVLL